MDSATETDLDLESDTSSVDLGPMARSREIELTKRVESLKQENKVLRMELDTLKMRVKSLKEDNKELRRASVNIQMKTEQEEEYISNTLLKKIQVLKKEKENLACNYEQEEEFLTNDLSRKLHRLRQEKVELEVSLEKEQESHVNKLVKKIEKLKAETEAKQQNLEQLKREKVDLENALEQEQEALVNRLWKQINRLEAEKRLLQEQLDQSVSTPSTPRQDNKDTGDLAQHMHALRAEVHALRDKLAEEKTEHEQMMQHYAMEERQVHEENVRLRRRLEIEKERREALCRHLSESETSLEMDDERLFNELAKLNDDAPTRMRTESSSSSISQSAHSAPSPMLGVRALENKCGACGQPLLKSMAYPTASSPPVMPRSPTHRRSAEQLRPPSSSSPRLKPA